MNSSQIQKGFIYSIQIFRLGLWLFLISTIFHISFKFNDSFSEFVFQISMFFTAIGFTLMILFRGNINIKKGYFGKLSDILIPWKF